MGQGSTGCTAFCKISTVQTPPTVSYPPPSCGMAAIPRHGQTTLILVEARPSRRCQAATKRTSVHCRVHRPSIPPRTPPSESQGVPTPPLNRG